MKFLQVLLQPALVAPLEVCPSVDQEVAGSTLTGQQHQFVEIDHEIFSTVILSFLLIQEGQLSVSGERMCTMIVNRRLSLSSKSVVR